MAIQKFKVYVHRDMNGKMPDFLSANNHAGQRCFESFTAVGPIEIDIDVPEIDIRQAAIDSLELRVISERNQCQQRVGDLQNRINKLMDNAQ